MVTCDQQEKISPSQNVLLWIFLEIRNLIWRYAELNRLLVGSGLIPLNTELQQDDRTVCCGHNTVDSIHPIVRACSSPSPSPVKIYLSKGHDIWYLVKIIGIC